MKLFSKSLGSKLSPAQHLSLVGHVLRQAGAPSTYGPRTSVFDLASSGYDLQAFGRGKATVKFRHSISYRAEDDADFWGRKLVETLKRIPGVKTAYSAQQSNGFKIARIDAEHAGNPSALNDLLKPSEAVELQQNRANPEESELHKWGREYAYLLSEAQAPKKRHLLAFGLVRPSVLLAKAIRKIRGSQYASSPALSQSY